MYKDTYTNTHIHAHGLDPSSIPQLPPLDLIGTHLDLSLAGLWAWITCKDLRKDFAKLIAKGEGANYRCTTAVMTCLM